jgi:DNA invertase Pin-like site-specific DNA recombinase
MNEVEFCDVADCDDPENRGFPRPVAGHGKSKCASHLKQLQRTGKTTTIASKLTLKQRFFEEVYKLADWDSDDDPGCERQMRKVLTMGKQAGMADLSERIRDGVKAARARGKRLGRPPKYDQVTVLVAFEALGSVTQVSRRLGIPRRTIYAYLGRSTVQKRTISAQSESGPRLAG